MMKINLELAKSYIGVPYVWGGEDVTNEGGFDCSGFLYKVLNGSGIKVPRLTAQGYFNLYKSLITNTPPREGDILFFGKSNNQITHCAIAINEKEMIESVGTKANTIKKKGKGVTINKISRRKDLVAICRFAVSKVILKTPDSTPNLRIGSRGLQVEYLQKCLNVLFSANLECDGIFGSKTRKALVKMQSASGLIADGVFGTHTRRVINDLVVRYNNGFI